jgi:RHS repeat-associated protein
MTSSMVEPHFSRRLATYVLSAMLLAASPLRAVPPSPNKDGGTTEKTGQGFGWVNQSGGTYQDAIPFDVPDYNGVEPDVRLVYSSAGGNGYVGVGWSLDGVSVIERAGAARGVPAYTQQDEWLLDGAKLRPCPDASFASPSCQAGGTHYTETESYERISFTPGASEDASSWVVTARDGSQTVFRAGTVVAVAGALRVYRYVVSEERDLTGHRTTYDWGHDLYAAPWAFPKAIDYRTGRVEFHWEPRPDVERYADGIGFGTTPGRIQTIAVYSVDEDGRRRLRHAYRLDYTTSALTGRSLLSSVQKFGTDAILQPEANGQLRVSGGSSSPPTLLAYAAPGELEYGTTVGDTGLQGWCFAGTSAGLNGQMEFTGDFNGDGRTDLGCRIGGVQYIAYSTAESGAGVTRFVDGAAKLTQYCGGGSDRQVVGDFNGDGLADLGCRTASGFSVAIATANGFQAPTMWAGAWCTGTDESVFSADFDGDGATDLGCRAGADEHVRLSRGTSLGADELWRGGWCAAPGYQFTGDFNGDGRTDVGCRTATGEQRVLISTGTGFGDGGTWLAAWCVQGDGTGVTGDYLFTGDFNGDGKEDLGCRAGGRQHVALSTGRSFTAMGPWDAPPGTCPNGASGGQFTQNVDGQPIEVNYAFEFPADFNGDGKTDVACRSGDNLFIMLSNGQDLLTVIRLASGCMDGTESGTGGLPLMLVGDFDGDGRTDTGCRQRDGRQTVALVSQVFPDLLVYTANELGATTVVEYRAATAWPDNHGLSGNTVTSVTTDDGRATSAETRFTYSGGRYDRLRKVPLGFAYSREIAPAIEGETDGPSTDTWYSQEFASRGLPVREEKRAGSGILLTREEFDYESRSTPPYRAHAVAHRTYQFFDGGGTSTCDGETTTYDTFGNVLAATDLGDCEVPGDETETVYTYSPNLSRFIVALIATEAQYHGAGATRTLIGETRHYYDLAGSHTTPPTIGLETREDERQDETTWTTTQTDYDERGNAIRMRDVLDAATTTDYDGLDRAIATTNPLGHVDQTAWDTVCGLPASQIDENGAVTRQTYDALCRPALTQEPAGGFTRYKYVGDGDPWSQYVEVETPAATGVAGAQWMRRYLDGLGRAYRIQARGPTDGATITTDTAWDARGNTADSTKPYYWDGFSAVNLRAVHTVYDALDRPIEIRTADGAAQQLVYRPRGTIHIDPLGHQQAEEFDSGGRRIAHAEVDESGRWITVSYDYDARGNLGKTTDPAGNETRYERDWSGQVVRLQDPDAGTISYLRDAKGRVIEEVDGAGVSTLYAYDALDRMTSRTLHARLTDQVVHTWEYDQPTGGAAVGRLTRSTYGSGNEEQFHYDDAGRTDRYVRLVDGRAFGYEYAYDAADHLLRIQYPDGTYDTDDESLSRTYDAAGRLSSIPGIVNELEYDAAGNVTRQDNANGTVTVTTFDQERDWLTALSTTSRTGALVQNYTYAHDADGAITRIEDRGVSSTARPGRAGSWAYRYDGRHQLVEVSSSGLPTLHDRFDYDWTGNIERTERLGTFSYNEAGAYSVQPHALLKAGVESFGYDANGNMTRAKGKRIDYGPQRKPRKIGVLNFEYDSGGHRYKKSKGRRSTLFPTEDYVLDSDGTTTKYIATDGPSGDDLVAKVVMKNGAKALYFLHTDHQGSINVVTDAAGGVALRREYGPWGEVAFRSSSFKEPRGYAGHYQDVETKMVFMRARYYLPSVGRFIQADNVVDDNDALGLHPYAYVENNPTNLTDPSGKCPFCLFLMETAVGFGIDYAVSALRSDDSTFSDFGKKFSVSHWDATTASGGTWYRFPAESGLNPMLIRGDHIDSTAGKGYFSRHNGRLKFARWSVGHVAFPKFKDKAYADSLLPVSATKQQHDQMVAQDWWDYNRFRAGVIGREMSRKHVRLAEHRIREAKNADSPRRGLERARAAIGSAGRAVSAALQTPDRRVLARAHRTQSRAVTQFLREAAKVRGRQCTVSRTGHRRCR